MLECYTTDGRQLEIKRRKSTVEFPEFVAKSVTVSTEFDPTVKMLP